MISKLDDRTEHFLCVTSLILRRFPKLSLNWVLFFTGEGVIRAGVLFFKE